MAENRENLRALRLREKLVILIKKEFCITGSEHEPFLIIM